MDTIIFTGNVGKDTEYSEKDGRGMAKFSVAVSKYANKEKTTVWRNVTVFGKQAEFCQDYVKKGRSVVVMGEPFERAYKNRLEELVGCIDVIANRVEPVGGAKESDQSSAAPKASTPVPDGFVQTNEELPF